MNKKQKQAYDQKHYRQKDKEEVRAYAKQYYQAHKEQIKARSKKHCQEHKEQYRAYYKKHYQEQKEQILAYSREHYQEHKEEIFASKQLLKKQVLTHYGKGKLACVRCGITDIDILCIDHIEGGGNKHRERPGRSGHQLYSRLKRNGYPSGYQTLCFNCNNKKRISEGK